MRESSNNRASKMEGNCLFDDSHSQSFFLLYSSELRVKDWFLRGWKKWSLSDKIHLSGSKNILLKNDVFEIIIRSKFQKVVSIIFIVMDHRKIQELLIFSKYSKNTYTAFRNPLREHLCMKQNFSRSGSVGGRDRDYLYL